MNSLDSIMQAPVYRMSVYFKFMHNKSMSLVLGVIFVLFSISQGVAAPVSTTQLAPQQLSTTARATPTPSGLERFWIGEQINQNGVPISVEGVQGALAIESVLSFYRNQWREPIAKNVPGFVEDIIGEWQLISRLEQQYNIVVQIKAAANGGVEGFISVLDITAEPSFNSVTRHFPKPSAVQILSSTESRDADVPATTIILAAQQSVDEVARFYREQMSIKGWSLKKELTQDSGRVLFFKDKGQKADIAITAGQGGTNIYATIVGE